MKRKSFYQLLIWSLVVFLVAIACNLSISTGDTTQPSAQPSIENTQASNLQPPVETPPPARVETLPPAEPSPTVQEAAATDPPAQPTPTSGPQCIVQQSLNLRSGPGTLYDPPIYSMESGTVLIPLGYNPVGYPGGSWVQVNDTAHNKIGWVSAGDQYVACNVDLTGLPTVVVDPPPAKEPPKTDPSGSDGDGPDNLVIREDFNQDYLLRFYAHDTNVGEKDGKGITAVEFTVTDENGDVVQSNSEETAGFCIFGGGEPDCNTWLLEDSVYKWPSTGEPVKDGVYELQVHVILDDDSNGDGNWTYQLTINVD